MASNTKISIPDNESYKARGNFTGNIDTLNTKEHLGLYWVELDVITGSKPSYSLANQFASLNVILSSPGVIVQEFITYHNMEVWRRMYTNSQWYGWVPHLSQTTFLREAFNISATMTLTTLYKTIFTQRSFYMGMDWINQNAPWTQIHKDICQKIHSEMPQLPNASNNNLYGNLSVLLFSGVLYFDWKLYHAPIDYCWTVTTVNQSIDAPAIAKGRLDQHHYISYGTSLPSTGADGDIFFKY